jgi:hypothetical protein
MRNSQTGNVTWSSYDLEGPFNGYAVYDYLNGLGMNMLALVSSQSDSGYGGGQVFGLDFDEKFEVCIIIIAITVQKGRNGIFYLFPPCGYR